MKDEKPFLMNMSKKQFFSILLLIVILVVLWIAVSFLQNKLPESDSNQSIPNAATSTE